MKRYFKVVLLMLLAALLALSAVAGAEGASGDALAANADGTMTVEYIDAGGEKHTQAGCVKAASGDTEWTNGQWIVAIREVTVDARVKVTGDVNLILANGAKLIVPNGITVNDKDGAKLTVWAQSAVSNVMGTLYSGTNKNDERTCPDDHAGIGGDPGSTAGTIIINGGMVNARGSQWTYEKAGAGIGGGSGGAGGAVVINGGIVRASSGNGYVAAGIGGGSNGAGGTVTITGGQVQATGGVDGAGIGGGGDGRTQGSSGGAGGTISISGGRVLARSAKFGAGIGGAQGGAGGSITISGGLVEAYGGEEGAGIGGGQYSSGGTITISGGNVVATGGSEAKGIGPGRGNDSASITLTYSDGDTGMSVKSNSYGGDVTLERGFISEDFETVCFAAGTYKKDASDFNIGWLSGATLIPAPHVNRVAVKYAENVEITVENTHGTANAGDPVVMTVVPRRDSDDYTYQKYSFVAEYEDGTGTQTLEPVMDAYDDNLYTFTMPQSLSEVRITAYYVSEWGRLYYQITREELDEIKLDTDVRWRGASGSYPADKSPLSVSVPITIDLNGHTIDRCAGNTAAEGAKVFAVAMGGNLTLKDTGAGGKVTGGYPLNGAGGGVTVDDGGEFTLEGGSITGNRAQLGGGVYVQSEGAFTMKSGSIDHNTALVQNEQFGNGGGVYNDGDFIMENGRIEDNVAVGCGGGVYNGGGIYDKGKFIMSGGHVSRNKAKGDGGGVYNNIDTEFILRAGYIDNNTIDATSHGSQVFNNGLTDADVSGETNEAGNHPDTLQARHEHTAPKFELSGGPAIVGEVYLCDGNVITVKSRLENKDPIQLGLETMGVFTKGYSDHNEGIPPYTCFEIVGEDGCAVSWSEDGREAMGAAEWKALHSAINWTPEAYMPIPVSKYAGNDGTITGKHTTSGTDDDVPLEVVSGRVVTLDLEGCTIDMGFSAVSYSRAHCSAFRVKGELTVKDSGGDGRITGSRTDAGGGVNVSEGGSFTLQSGSITGNQGTDGGGGVYVTGAGSRFTMTGGSITHNSSNKGGGVCVQDGASFTFEGGSVSDNTGGNGAGVYIEGTRVTASTFVMSGGRIEANSATGSGGGVSLLKSASFTMGGGDIGMNTANQGGGVSIQDSLFTMNGGTIRGNAAECNDMVYKYGGGVYVEGRFAMSGGEISGNWSKSGGGGIYLNNWTSGTAVTLSGKPVITGNREGGTRASDGAVTGGEKCNLYLTFRKLLTVSGPFDDGARVGLRMNSPGVFSSGYNAHNPGVTPRAFFESDHEDYIVGYAEDGNGEASLVAGSGSWPALQNALACAPGENPTVKASDFADAEGRVTAGQADKALEVKAGRTVTLDLNGCVVDRGLAGAAEPVDDGEVIAVSGDLTVTDTAGNGTITGGKNRIAGSGLVVNGRFVLKGGSIRGNGNGIDGSAGGGVYVYGDGALFGMSGGIIEQNAGSMGGGVYIAQSGRFEMTGGEIRGNAARQGSVYVMDGSFSLSGKPVITGNTEGAADQAGNVYLPNGKVITVSGALEAGAQIGVMMEKPGLFTTGYALNNPDHAPDAFFKSDIADYAVIYDPSGSEATLKSEWQVLQAAINAASAGDTVDVSLYAGEDRKIVAQRKRADSDATEDALQVNEGKRVTLDLRGCTIDRNLGGTGGYDWGEVIQVDGGDLTIMDSGAGNGVITGGNTRLNGGGLIVVRGGRFELAGGTIAGNKSLYSGGGVCISDSTFVMSGGSIADNVVFNEELPDLSGGGVSVESSSTFSMTGGTITGNTAVRGGGLCVCDRSAFSMSGGAITGNTANQGGGVDVDYSTFTMTGGSITNNGANCYDDVNRYDNYRYGGGVYVGGTFNMSGGEISGNWSRERGGGIYLSDSNASYAIRLSGNPVITANLMGGTRDDDGIVTGGEQSNLYLPNGKTVTVIGPFEDGARIGVRMVNPGKFTDGYDKSCNGRSPYAFFDSDHANYIVGYAGDSTGEASLAAGSGPWQALQNALSYAPGENPTVMADDFADAEGRVTARQADQALEVKTGRAVILDLNGCAVDRGLQDQTEYGEVINVSGSLTIQDSSTAGNGKITGGRNFFAGSGVIVSGHLVMKSGSIADNGVEGNAGGGVYVHGNGAVFEMSGGIIENNVGLRGSGVFISEGGSFTMTGGVIRNNASDCGAVFLGYDGKAFNLSGKPVITGNTMAASDEASNVYLYTGMTLTVTGKLDEGARVGVTMMDPGVFTAGYDAHNPDTVPDVFFASDMESYAVDYDPTGNEAMLGSEWQCLQAAIDAAADGATVDVSRYAGSDGKIVAQRKQGGSDETESALRIQKRVTLDLKGCTIDRNLGTTSGFKEGEVIRVVGGNLTVMDSKGNGIITGGNSLSNGGGVLIGSGTFTMTGGQITGNKAAHGGGVYVQGSFNLSGRVKVTGNHDGDSRADDIFLDSDRVIALVGALDGEAQLGVRAQVSPTADAPVFIAVRADGSGTEYAVAANFISNDDSYGVGTKSDDHGMQFVLSIPYTVEYDANGGSFEEGIAQTETRYYGEKVTPPVPTREGYKQKGWEWDGAAFVPEKDTIVAETRIVACWLRLLTITADDGTKAYDGTALVKDSYTNTGLEEGDSIKSVTVTGSQTQVGESGNVPSEAKIMNATGEDVTANYVISYVNGTLEVTPRAVTVKADGKTKVYDNDATNDPELTATVTDAVAGDTINYTLSREAGQDVGEYAITVTPGENPNYAVSVEGGAFTITPKAVTVKADDKTKVYDSDAATDPALTATVTDAVADDAINYTLSRAEGQNVGEYAITVKAGDNPNYTVSVEDGTFSITPKAVTVKADDKTKVYDNDVTADPELTATVDGAVAGDAINYT
ncbi:MAG: InlB B-repeat-containing protein, partial [Clostridia bacterium]|nr:InlB B-repeat-containing protein [Clostridia bacterium]